jgi:outer membrane putative beta-barrel porin/alpha-amylase
MSARNARGCRRNSLRHTAIALLVAAVTAPAAAAQAPAQLPSMQTTPMSPMTPTTAPTSVMPTPSSSMTPTAASKPIQAVAIQADGSTSEITLTSCVGCSSHGAAPAYGAGVYGWGHKHGPPACAIGGCGDEGCGEAGCHAGYFGCDPYLGQHRLTRLVGAFHNALCCPDPCYEPRWECAANAALFTPSARPATYTRLRWDAGRNLIQPDRAEYFWAQIGGKGPANPETRVNYNELSLYAEMGGGRFSFYINTPYRNQEGDVNGGSGGFGDLTLGTKTLLIDSELMQITFALGTTIPVGLSGKGLGTGHVSMDPSLLWAIKLYPETWWQGQLGYWIPISGTPGFAGSILFYNNTLNHLIARPLADTALIGTIETSGWTFTSGSVTDANGVVHSANDTTYFALGPGLRLCFCDKLDFGFGVQFAVTGNRFAERLYRTEIRWRF